MLLVASGPDDEPFEVHFDDAAEWLLGNDTGDGALNRQSVRLYDFADTDEVTAARRASPRDAVTFSDLGRMASLAASLTYERAHLLMRLSRTVAWPGDLPRLDDCPLSDQGIDDFISHTGVERAHDLFRTFKDHSGLGSGTVSKLLHLKWPAFYPIVDSQFRGVYWRRAAQLHAHSDVLEGTPNNDGNIRAYWLAFRADLAHNHGALTALPARIEALAEGDVDALAHARRLAQLEPVRLLDMLVWKTGP